MSLVVGMLTRAGVTEWAVTIASVIAAGAAVWGVVKGVRHLRRRWANNKARIDAVVDVLLGTDEEPANTVTGTPAKPAVPGIGARVAKIEDALPALADAVSTLVKNQAHLQVTDQRLDRVEARVTALESQAVERVVTKVESTAAWLAVEAVANQGGEHESPQIEE